MGGEADPRAERLGAVRPSSDEIRSLTGLRALLAWLVVGFHFLRGVLPPELAFLRRVLVPGHLAVDAFFILSGYVLARRYAADAARPLPWRRGFFVRRFARLYPLYLVALLVGMAASWPAVLGDFGTARGRVRLLLDVGLLNAWSHTAMFRYNWAAWSLSVEAFFYLLVPVILPALVRRTKARGRALLVVVGCAWAATFVAPALYAYFDPDHLGRPPVLGDEVLWVWYLKFFPLQRLPELVAGMAVALLPPPSPRVARFAPLAAIVLVAVATSGIVPYAYVHSGVLMPLVVLLLVTVAATPGGWLASRGMVLFGHASYATYILHVPFFLLLARFEPALWERPALVLGYMALLAVLSLAAYRFVEEPLRRRITRALAANTR